MPRTRPRALASARIAPRSTVWVALLALMAVLAATRVATAAEPATLRLLGSDPAHPLVWVTRPDGGRNRGGPGWFRLRVTPRGGGPAVEHRGFCADLRHSIETGVDYDVSLRTAADEPALASPRMAEAAWLVDEAEGLIAAASDRRREAGAIQVAIWQLVGDAREESPTDDAALNRRAAELRALAAGRAIAGPIDLAAASPHGCAGGEGVALRLTGTPGTTADLRAEGPGAVVSPARVTFGPDGVAVARVGAAAAGAVRVTARARGGVLTRIARAAAGQTTPQETFVVVRREWVATRDLTFGDCPPPPGPEPAPDPPLEPFGGPGPGPFSPPAAAPPADAVSPPAPAPRRRHDATSAIRLVKRGPARMRAGTTGVYVIRVVNRGTAPVRGLVIADLLPDGMSLVAVPRGAALRAGRVRWRPVTLGPGRSRTVSVRVRLDADLAGGRRCNRADARAPGVASATASRCTRVIAVPRRVMPAVTS